MVPHLSINPDKTEPNSGKAPGLLSEKKKDNSRQDAATQRKGKKAQIR